MREDVRARRVAQRHRGRELVPGGIAWHDRAADVHLDGTAPRQPLAVTQHRARAADGHRQHRHAGRRRRHEGPEAERAQSGCACEGALGKKARRSAGLHRGTEVARVLDALAGIEALDELGPQAPQVDAADRVFEQLALGHEGEVHRHGRAQHQRIQIAGVVGHQHAGCVWQVLQPAHGEPDAAQREKNPCGHAVDAPCQCGARRGGCEEPGRRRDQAEQQGDV